jgi:hypothetical protein
MGKSKRISVKVRKLYKEMKIDISPVMAGMLEQCDRIQAIMDQLWELATEGPLTVSYTNKAGATNEVANASLKELRSWELVFQGCCRSIFNVLRNDLPRNGDEIDDELSEFLGEC